MCESLIPSAVEGSYVRENPSAAEGSHCREPIRAQPRDGANCLSRTEPRDDKNAKTAIFLGCGFFIIPAVVKTEKWLLYFLTIVSLAKVSAIIHRITDKLLKKIGFPLTSCIFGKV